jgi:hypothetical protein
VSVAFPTDDGDPLARPRDHGVAARIGRASAVSMGSPSIPLTLYCGLNGVAIVIDRGAVDATLSGTIANDRSASSPTRTTFVVDPSTAR